MLVKIKWTRSETKSAINSTKEFVIKSYPHRKCLKVWFEINKETLRSSNKKCEISCKLKTIIDIYKEFLTFTSNYWHLKAIIDIYKQLLTSTS